MPVNTKKSTTYKQGLSIRPHPLNLVAPMTSYKVTHSEIFGENFCKKFYRNKGPFLEGGGG